MKNQLQQELHRCQPFASVQQEALVSVLRTSDQLENLLVRFFRRFELTLSQFNLLKTLQLEKRPLTCGEIAERMVQIVPAITGLVDRLEQQKLVRRERCTGDRRVVYVSITTLGQSKIRQLDAPLRTLERTSTTQLSQEELHHLIDLLGKLRHSLVESFAPETTVQTT